MRSILSFVTAGSLLLTGASAAPPPPPPAGGPPKPGSPPKPAPISHNIVFDPPADYRDPQVLYARTAQLPNNNLLLTWENYSPENESAEPVYFPIYTSLDAARSWSPLSNVTDQATPENGLRYQPCLYVLPEPVGAFPAGTLLLAGSSIPSDLSTTQLELYASHDSGKSWKFISHIALGGEAQPVNGIPAVWEPFLLAHKGELIYYYSDQRDPKHGQKLVHQTSRDLVNWGPVKDDTAYPTYTDRPGMPTVAKLPNGEFIYVYEYGGGPNPNVTDGRYTFPVYYRLSKDPERFMEAEHHPIRIPASSKIAGASGVVVPDGSPYVVWTPAGGPMGTIVVSSGCCSEVYINKFLGREDKWEIRATPEPASYTRSLLVMQQNPEFLLISGGGKLPPAGGTNVVSVSVIKI